MSEADYLVGVEEYELAFVEDVLDDAPVDAQTVYKETIDMSERAIAAEAAYRATTSGGGGGSPTGAAGGVLGGTYPNPGFAADMATQAELDAHAAATSGAARVLGPFPFAFDDPGLEDGIAFYTPTVGDVLLNAWIEVETGFDGTTPHAEIGTFVGSNNGLFNFSLGAPDISMADAEWIGAGMQHGSTMTSAEHNQAAYASSLTAQVDGAGPYLTLQPDPTFLAARGVPLKFSAANPLKIVVSQNGAKGGAAVGGSAGAAGIYLIVSTPSLT